MKEKTKQTLRSHFSATHIAYMALFTALAFAVTFLEFPIFPAAPYLKFDFANVFFMIEGFGFGPVEAIFSILVKELLCLTKSSTGGVGEIANFLMSAAYVIVPSILYRFKKGRTWVALYLVFGCLLQIAVSLPVNRYINFPFFMGEGAAGMFASVWGFVLGFNVIKSVSISVVVFVVYKPLSRLIKATAARFRGTVRAEQTPQETEAQEEAQEVREEVREEAEEGAKDKEDAPKED